MDIKTLLEKDLKLRNDINELFREAKAALYYDGGLKKQREKYWEEYAEVSVKNLFEKQAQLHRRISRLEELIINKAFFAGLEAYNKACSVYIDDQEVLRKVAQPLEDFKKMTGVGEQ